MCQSTRTNKEAACPHANIFGSVLELEGVSSYLGRRHCSAAVAAYIQCQVNGPSDSHA